MSDNQLSTLWGASSSGLVSVVQLLAAFINPKSRKELISLIKSRGMIAIGLAGLFWQLNTVFPLKKLLWRLWAGHAVIRSEDQAFKWIMHFLTTHPSFRASPREVDVTAKPVYSIGVEGRKAKLIVDRTKIIDTKGKMVQTATECTIKDKEGREDMKKYFKPASSLTMFFLFEKTPFWAQRARRETRSGSIRETITLTYWSFSTDPLHRLVDHACKMYAASQKGRDSVTVHCMDRYGHWVPNLPADKRSLDTVYLPMSLKEDILQDARRFFSNEEKQQYAKRGVPYRRGLLFFGEPGNGKSTLCCTLASELGESIYTLNLNSKEIDDHIFLAAMSSLPNRCIVLIEDVDVAFVNRKENSSSSESNLSKESGVSFSALLNALDGVGAPSGRLLCITTNHIGKLDAALLRPGRIDKKYEIKNATQEQANELFLRWFKPEVGAASRELEQQATVFAKSIPAGRLSMAVLQGYLIGCDNDPQKAIQDLSKWVEAQE